MSDFVIRPAVRVNTPAFIALAGTTGTGKTRSALELATGLAGDNGKILLADTEGNRALHYADLYTFDHVEFQPPYSPERCGSLIDLAEKHGYAVLIVDSASDEHEGEGGLQEIHEELGKADEFWQRTKARHKHHLVNRIRRARIHTIWCLRCEERVKITKVFNEQRRALETQVEHLGWQPICEKRFLYEMQSSFRFDPDRPGVPVPIKLYDIHAKFFPLDQKITRAAGAALAAWAAGAAVPIPDQAPNAALAHARNEAQKGTEHFRRWWSTVLSKEQRKSVSGHLSELRETAANADARNTETPEPASTPAAAEPQKGNPEELGVAANDATTEPAREPTERERQKEALRRAQAREMGE